LLLELPERFGFGSPSCLFLLAPTFGLLANALFLFGHRETDVAQRLLHERMSGAVPFEQCDRSIPIAARQQALRGLNPFRRYSIARFLPSLALLRCNEIGYASSEGCNARIVEPNRSGLIEMLESSWQAVLLNESLDPLERTLECLLFLSELPLRVERLRHFSLQRARARGPLFARYGVDRGLCFLEVTSIGGGLCFRENRRVRSKALRVA
jgi:hypothetical protein